MTEDIIQEQTKPKAKTRKTTTIPKTNTKTTASKAATKSTSKSAQPTKSKSVTKKIVTETTRQKPSANVMSSEERHQLISETAYYIAEKRGFIGGNPEDDWAQAETIIEKSLEDA